ncbi:platelet-derived growth factor receptor beta-like [Anopheles ziemanni]|uniref:platelet-derived growth factor receptor beta-like n=1 Tax=Anopheles coustani TaxID=139045 RepID=UPI002658D21A|nr:platelet-derived growth factor receptor beta-like [Anopheles coustani]XP_058170208.1 platelet-derived growth factor receptor beta-like [Anopheles ziemanni]
MAQAKDIMVHEPFTTVAVKQTKDCGRASIIQGMISEIKMMILVGQHLNIVNFLGTVTENIESNELMIILEYCRYGNVLSFMQSKRSTFVNCIDDLPITWISSIMNPEPGESDPDDESQMSLRTTDLVCWATQIAFGMEYLSSKNIFHGDLAARNVLLCEKGVVKIADFGLAREFNCVTHYKKARNDRVPFKWMALESIFEHKFSIKTDVWSYGVLLWELFTLGMPPYPTLAVNDEFFQKLRDGYRLDKPMYANEDIYATMLSYITKPSGVQLSSPPPPALEPRMHMILKAFH